MRDFKFRGKDCYTDEWHYGDLLTWCGAGQPQIKDWSTEDFHDFDVEMDSVGQFTGLRDKNGKQIFEGDVIRCRKGEKRNNPNEPFVDDYVTYVIEYENGVFSGVSMWALSLSSVEVIGNIHDNPELMKGTGT